MGLTPCRFTLRQLLVAACLFGITALATTVIVLVKTHLRAYFYGDLLTSSRTLAETLAEDSRMTLILNRPETIQSRLETIITYPNVVGVLVAATDGNVVASSGETAPVLRAGALADLPQNQRDTDKDSDLMVVLAPVRAAKTQLPAGDPSQSESAAMIPSSKSTETQIGTVALLLNQAKLKADLRKINEYILMIMVVAMVLFTAMLLFLLRQITQPIKRLALAMVDSETVEHFRPVAVYGVHEARTIAKAFNRLLGRIAETDRARAIAYQQVQASRANLAQEVAQAVATLERQNTELSLAREQAEQASRAKSQFIANISHEIRTPMHGLLGALSLLEKTPLTDKQKSHLIMMREDARRLLRETNNILDFSQLEARGLRLRERPCNFQRLVERTVRQFAARADAKKLDLALAFDPAAPVWIRADGEQLEKVLGILIDNAIKFTLQGRVRVRVGRRGNLEGAFLYVAVGDTGIGIPRQQQGKIFESFTQADSSLTRKQGGSGLGLAICRQLVELMRGDLKLYSQPGKGSIFAVKLPLALARPVPEPAHEASEVQEHVLQRLVAPQDEPISARRLGNAFRRGGGKVLVVDDERQSRLYAQFVLLELNVEVITAASGPEALTACEEQRFDLILMDVRMPDMDGLEAARRIRHQRGGCNARTPIIGLTADVLSLDRQDWQAAGMNACHNKPLESEEFSALFARWGIGRASGASLVSTFLRKYHDR